MKVLREKDSELQELRALSRMKMQRNEGLRNLGEIAVHRGKRVGILAAKSAEGNTKVLDCWMSTFTVLC